MISSLTNWVEVNINNLLLLLKCLESRMKFRVNWLEILNHFFLFFSNSNNFSEQSRGLFILFHYLNGINSGPIIVEHSKFVNLTLCLLLKNNKWLFWVLKSLFQNLFLLSFSLKSVLDLFKLLLKFSDCELIFVIEILYITGKFLLRNSMFIHQLLICSTQTLYFDIHLVDCIHQMIN